MSAKLKFKTRMFVAMVVSLRTPYLFFRFFVWFKMALLKLVLNLKMKSAFKPLALLKVTSNASRITASNGELSSILLPLRTITTMTY